MTKTRFGLMGTVILVVVLVGCQSPGKVTWGDEVVTCKVVRPKGIFSVRHRRDQFDQRRRMRNCRKLGVKCHITYPAIRWMCERSADTRILRQKVGQQQ